MRTFVQGVNWTVLQQVVYVAINYTSLILLTWHLNPSDFGLIALSTILIGLFEMLNGFGIPQLIIKDQIMDAQRIGYYVFVCLRLSLILAVLSAASGFLYVQWYGAEIREVLTMVILVSSTGILYNSIVSIYNALYQRDLDFKTPVVFLVIGLVIGNVIAVIFAASGAGYWSLVIRNLGPTFIVMLGFIFFSKYKITLNFSAHLQADEKRFSIWLSSNQVINYCSRNLDYLILGKFFEVGIVGQYSIAYRLMLFPMKFLSSRIQTVLYPTLVRMKETPDLMLDFYVKVVSYIGFASFPLMGLAGVLSPIWVPMLFDVKQYFFLVPLIQWLTLAGAFQAVTSPIGTLYLAHNMVRLMAIYSTVSAAIFLIGYAIGAKSGNIILFAIIYTFLSVVINFLAANFVPLRKLRFKFLFFLKSTMEPVLPTVGAYFFAWCLLYIWRPDTIAERFFALGSLGLVFALIYIIIYWLLFRRGFREKFSKLKLIYS